MRILIQQRPDPTGLRSTEILGNDATTGHEHREFVIHIFRRRAVRDGMEPRLAIWMGKDAVFKKARRTGMLRRWTRPKDPFILFDLFVRNTPVIYWTADRSATQFIEQFFRL